MSITRDQVINPDVYLHPVTEECMRKVTVWTRPSTGQAIRRFRAMPHAYDAQGRCVHCGFYPF